MLLMNEPTDLLLKKVISGGQIGADEAGLFAASQAGLETGGTAPMKYRIHNGFNPLLKEVYGLREDDSFSYKPRTIKNVMEADGTVIIAKNIDSPGCALTYRTCLQRNKPVFVNSVPDRKMTDFELEDYTERLREWMIHHCIVTLNVAGNRDHLPGNYRLFDTVVEILTPIFEEAASLG